MQNWRPRENRKTVRIGVRVRTDTGWTDATIRNVSNRGMMLQTLQPLRRNQFVEIARGRHRMAGRIVWSRDSVCGLQVREQVDIPGLLAPPDESRAVRGTERRIAQRPEPAPGRYAASLAERAQSSRLLGRAFEKAFMVVALASVSVVAVGSALEAADAPLEQVRMALAGPSSAS